jgi:predicted extracellular nuclease
MRRRACACAGLGVLLSYCAAPLHALTIYDIQHTTTDGDASVYAGGHHDVTGGIVVHKWGGGQYPRVYLQDPAHTAWGAICVKDWEGAFYNDVEVGDAVNVNNIYVEEFRGNTYLQYSEWYSPDATYSIESGGNQIPDPVLLTVADMPAPIEGPPGQWYVENHDAEPYESMMVRVEYATVGTKGFGKADDNYELIQGDDAAWAADYMNIHKPSNADYDPRIETGVLLESISGVFEQYTYNEWDYYQLCTRSAGDITVARAVPTVSEWGLAVMTLLIISTGSVLVRRLSTCCC